MKNKKILILKSDKDDFEKYYIKKMQGPEVDTNAFYVCSSGPLWMLNVFWQQKMKLPFSSIWYGKWKKRLKKYDIVIIFDRNLNWNIVKYIKKINPEISIIIWYWNIISNNKLPIKYKNFCSEWSFNQRDCDIYGFHYNHQFYFEQSKVIDDRYRSDFVFIGQDKGRIKDIENIYKLLSSYGYKVRFIVIKDQTSKHYKSELYVNRNISYDEYLRYVCNTKCIVELHQKGQNGMTSRVMEAIYYEKKILALDEKIVSDLKENVLLYKPSLEKQSLMDFMCSPYVKTDTKEYYSFENWLNTFFM